MAFNQNAPDQEPGTENFDFLGEVVDDQNKQQIVQVQPEEGNRMISYESGSGSPRSQIGNQQENVIQMTPIGNQNQLNSMTQARGSNDQPGTQPISQNVIVVKRGNQSTTNTPAKLPEGHQVVKTQKGRLPNACGLDEKGLDENDDEDRMYLMRFNHLCCLIPCLICSIHIFYILPRWFDRFSGGHCVIWFCLLCIVPMYMSIFLIQHCDNSSVKNNCCWHECVWVLCILGFLIPYLLFAIGESQPKYTADILAAQKATSCSFSEPVQRDFTFTWDACIATEESCSYDSDGTESCSQVCVAWEARDEVERYTVFKARFLVDGVERVGCACISDWHHVNNNYGDPYNPFYFERFDDNGDLKFPSRECFPYDEDTTVQYLEDQSVCFVSGNAKLYSSMDSTDTICFPSYQEEAVIVFGKAGAGAAFWGAFNFELYFMSAIFLMVLCFLPVEICRCMGGLDKLKCLLYCPYFFGAWYTHECMPGAYLTKEQKRVQAEKARKATEKAAQRRHEASVRRIEERNQRLQQQNDQQGNNTLSMGNNNNMANNNPKRVSMRGGPPSLSD